MCGWCHAMIDLSASALDVAPALLGATLRANGVGIRITETEAYLGAEDPASHAFKGPSERNASMFLAGGHAYTYLIYGVHVCLNIVTGEQGNGQAVLIRAGEVIEGEELARERRPNVIRSRDLAKGPANLVACLGLSLEYDGEAIAVDNPEARAAIHLVSGPECGRVAKGARVGVSGIGGDRQLFPWRFWCDADPTVSPYRRGGGARAKHGRKADVDARNVDQLGFA